MQTTTDTAQEATLHWIKLHHSIIDDPKIARLSDNLWRRWVEIQLIAGRDDSGGVLPPVADLAWILRVDPDTLRNELEALQDAGLVESSGADCEIIGFEASQTATDNATRQRRYRERQRVKKAAAQLELPVDDDRNGDRNEPRNEPRNGDRDEGRNEKRYRKEEESESDNIGSRSEPRRRKRSQHDIVKAALEQRFYELTKIQPPKIDGRTSATKRREAAVLWWEPLSQIAKARDDDVEAAIALLELSIDEMKADGLRLKNPKSVLGVAAGHFADDIEQGTKLTLRGQEVI